MVTITKVNDSIKFEFEDSQHYLVGNGEITVPMNSLMLTLDESNMATFKKIDGDPFISFLIEESNFADKDALLDFYETEMTGGAGLPIEEIQQMIDESISGISATSMSAVTYVNSWASGNINNQKVGFWWEKADGSSGNTTVLSAKTNGDISLIDNEIKLNSAFTSTLITDAQYVGSANTINFLNSSGETIATIDTSDFVIDGMVEDVRIEEISGATYLVIDFNTASGQQDIQIPLTEIFDPSKYYTSEEVDYIIDKASIIGEYVVEGTLIPKHFWNDENMGCYTDIGAVKSIKVPCNDLLENPYIVLALSSDEEFMEGNGYVATVENGAITSLYEMNGAIAELSYDFNENTVMITADGETFDDDGLGVIAVVGIDYEPSSFMDLSLTVEGKCIDIVTTVLDIPEETVQERLDRIYDDVGKLEDFNPISDLITLDSGTNNIGREWYTYIGYGTLNYNTYNPLTDKTVSGNTADIFKFDTKDFKAENNIFKFNQSVISLDALSPLSPIVVVTSFTDGDVTTVSRQLFGDCIVIETNPNSTSNYNDLNISISGPNGKSGSISIRINTIEERGLNIDVSYNGKQVIKTITQFSKGDTLVVDLRNDWTDTSGVHTLTVHNEMESDLINSIKFYNTNSNSLVPLADVAQSVLNGHYPTYAELKEELKVKADIEAIYTYDYGDESGVTISNSIIYPNAYGFEVYGLQNGNIINFYTETNGVSVYNAFTVGEEGEIDRLRSKTYINKELTTYEDGTLKVFVKTTDTVITRIYVSDGNQYDGLVYQSLTMTSMRDDINEKQDTLIAGENITIVDNVISAEGGGATYTAGDGITISGNVISWSADKEEVIAKTFFQLNDKINTKQDLLTAGEGIDITDNVISVAITSSVTSASTDSEIPTAKAVFDAVGQGGGATYSAGTNISIDTANTISCTLPISTGSNERSIIIGGSGTATQPMTLVKGVSTEARAVGATCFGFNSSARGNYSFVCGEYLDTAMESSAVFGKYNNNNGLSLFSVGNGTSSSAKHNAFEIRENGDIYISSGGTDIKLQDNLGGGGIDSGTVQSMIDESISGKVETSAITSSVTSASTDSEIPTAKAVFDALEGQGGGLDEDFLQANANALYELKQEGKATNERFDNYYTKTASDGRYASNASIKKAYYDKAYVDDKLLAISASLNELNDDKQDALVAGDGISISGNVISAEGGGGAEYSAGTNIEITTANTINCTIPISAGTGSHSIKGNGCSSQGYASVAMGTSCTAKGQGSVAIGDACEAGTNTYSNGAAAFGYYTSAKGYYAFAAGNRTQCTNSSEAALGSSNKSVNASTAFGNSGNTLFSVGNGGGPYNMHNALEIRQNGDIYIANTDDTTSQNYYEKPMVRLQDTITATAANTTALGGLKLQQITQADYDALVSGGTVDSSTLYIITNVVN